jgi:hypothetical protein
LTTFTGKSVGAVKLTDSTLGSEIKCSKEELEGEIEFGSTRHGEEVIIKFKGCYAVITVGGKKIKCKVKTPGQPLSTIKTKRLDRDLGEVLLAEAATEVGLDLEPEIGTVITTIAASTECKTPLTPIEGSIIGEMTPTGPPETLEKKRVSTTVAAKQKIQNFVAEPKDTLEAFATEATLTSTVNLKFAEILEVT